jgi:uncharacterized protein YjlB
MLKINTFRSPDAFKVPGNDIFPNSPLPVIIYRRILSVPFLFAYGHVKKLFSANDWTNAWRAGIFTYHHYHSNTHEVMAVINGETSIMLGGDNGLVVTIAKGDIIIIPAGIAHKNLGEEDDVTCVGAYPEGRSYDMNYGNPGERPRTDENIRNTPVPAADPVLGIGNGVVSWWASLLSGGK